MPSVCQSKLHHVLLRLHSSPLTIHGIVLRTTGAIANYPTVQLTPFVYATRNQRVSDCSRKRKATKTKLSSRNLHLPTFPSILRTNMIHVHINLTQIKCYHRKNCWHTFSQWNWKHDSENITTIIVKQAWFCKHCENRIKLALMKTWWKLRSDFRILYYHSLLFSVFILYHMSNLCVTKETCPEYCAAFRRCKE